MRWLGFIRMVYLCSLNDFEYNTSRKNIDVVALGEAMVEFNQTSPTQPQYLQGFGGDTSNAVIAAARAGCAPLT